MCVASILMMGCPDRDSDGNTNASQGVPVQDLLIEFDQTLLLPTSVLSLKLRGTERVVAKKVVISLDGQLDGSQPFSWSYELLEKPPMAVSGPADEIATSSEMLRSDGDTGDIVARHALEDSLWAAVMVSAGPRQFSGEVRVNVVDLLDRTVAQGVLMNQSLTFQQELTPEVAPIQGGDVYAGERLPLTGAGFLRPEEGSTFLVVEQGQVTFTQAGGMASLDGKEIPLIWDGNRQRAQLLIDAAVFGVRKADFQGNVKFINRLRDGRVMEGNAQSGVTFSLQESFISTLACGDQDPCIGGSRGQRIQVRGRGLIAPRGGALMTLRFEGIFTPDDPTLSPLQLSGDTALERAPDRYFDDELVEISVWYEIERVGRVARLTGLGSTPGVFRGYITPILTDPYGTQAGIPWQGEFRVLPSRQVVYMKYLPRFSTGLEKYGLRNVENQIRAQILKAASQPYSGFNVTFVDTPPQDFLDYATIELSGPDPFGDGVFGYDNSTNDGIVKDTGNLFLADYIGGYNQGSAEEFNNPYGGIYIESFDYFSPTLSARKNGTAVDDASELFDEVLSPFMPSLGGTPIKAAEIGSGERDAEIERAIQLFGNVIGNTVAHEVGHSMGLAYFRGDETGSSSGFHNTGDLPGALMDSGGSRSFEERAAIDGVEPATFNATNAEYLGRILPKP